MDRDKRECILLAAANAFSHFGFKKASIDEIARDAGVGKGTIYLAARSKKDLFYQVLTREVRSFAADNAREIDPREDVVTTLEALVRREVRSVEARPLVRRLLAGELHGLLPSWRDRLAELLHLARANVLEVLRLGARQGRFRKDLDLEEVAVLLQDLQIASIRFPEAPAERDGAQLHRWETAITAFVEGIGRSAPASAAHVA